MGFGKKFFMKTLLIIDINVGIFAIPRTLVWSIVIKWLFHGKSLKNKKSVKVGRDGGGEVPVVSRGGAMMSNVGAEQGRIGNKTKLKGKLIMK